MDERTAGPRHEAARAAVPMALVPRVLLADPVLSLAAKGLVAEAVASGGRLPVSPIAKRSQERPDDVVDAVGDLLRLGYALLESGDVLVLTPPAGWAA